MRRRFLLLAIIFTALTSWAKDSALTQAATTADQCLRVAPLEAFDLIDMNTRLDMLDYFHAGSERHSRNALGGDCYITADTDYSIEMVGGNDIRYQIFVLNPNSTAPVIGVIETLATPMPDSRIRFYDSKWQPLMKLVLPKTTLAQWLKPQAKKELSAVEEQLPFMMAEYSYDPETLTLTLTHSMHDYFLPSDKPQALSLIKDRITYVWDGTKFKPAK